MMIPAIARPLQGAVLLACALLTGTCAAATGVGVASAKVLPATLSASVALYMRTSCRTNCGVEPKAAPPTVREATVSMNDDGVAQFTMFGETSSNYVVRLSTFSSPGSPILLEPTLTSGGRLSIVIAMAPASTGTDAFQVVINYN